MFEKWSLKLNILIQHVNVCNIIKDELMGRINFFAHIQIEVNVCVY